MIERLFESAVMSAVATDEYAYWRLIVEAGVLFSSWFMQDISYAVWNGRTVKDILNLVSKDIKIFPKC